MPHVFSVTIEPDGWEFQADDAVPLLISAERAGLRLRSSCRNGTCRTCMCRMRAGRVSYRIEWPGLSLEEKRDGYILPCVAFAESDITLEAGAVQRSAVSTAL